MNYVVISPNYPKNFEQFSISLAKKGIKVLGIGDESYENLSQELKEVLTEYFKVESLLNENEVKRALAFLYYKHGKIDRLESQNEFWMELDASLREEFNIEGLKLKELEKTKRKSEMKKIFEMAKVPVVPGYLVKERADILKGVKKLSLPLIAKPDKGVGAYATYKLETINDVSKFEQEFKNVDYFLEPFVYGDIITYDGLLDKNGNIVFETGMKYSATPLQLLTKEKDITYFVTKDINKNILEYGHRIIKEFGMKERFFHIEFFEKEDGTFVTIEYNNRPPGAYLVDMYNYAYSRSLYDDYANIVCGEEISKNNDNDSYCIATTRRNEIEYKYSEEEIYEKYSCKT